MLMQASLSLTVARESAWRRWDGTNRQQWPKLRHHVVALEWEGYNAGVIQGGYRRRAVPAGMNGRLHWICIGWMLGYGQRRVG